MGSAFWKSLGRALKGSWGRFLALLGIVALGCGFFAGLNMVGRDMRLAADGYYDAARLYDIRLISSMGLTDRQVQLVSSAEGVESVMPGWSVDCMVSLNDDQYAVRIGSLPEGAASGTDDGSYLNQIELVEGSWPAAPDECVMSCDAVMREELSLGDTVEVLYGTADIGSVLAQKTFKVTGLVRTPDYVDASMLGTTTLGSGFIEQYLYVEPEAFVEDLPYTQVYVTAEGAAAADAFSDGYQDIVDGVEERLDAASSTIAKDRLDEVRAQVQEEVDRGRADYESQKEDALSQLEGAQATLDEALSALQENQAALDAGRAEAAQGWQQYWAKKAEAERQLAAAEAQLEASQAMLDAAEARLGMSAEDIAAARQELAAGGQALEEGKAEWEKKRASLLQAQDDLGKIQELLSTYQAWLAREDVPDEAELEELADETRSGIECAKDLASLGLIDLSSDETRSEIESLAQEIEDIFGDIDFTQPQDEVLDEIRKRAPEAVGLVQDRLVSAQDQIASGIEEGDQKLEEGARQLADSSAMLDEAERARAQIDEGRARLAAGREQYESQKAAAEEGLAAARQKLEAADAQIASGQEELERGYESYEVGTAELARSRSSAEAELADAAQQIAAAQDAVDSLEVPKIYILDRTKGVGQASYADDAERIDRIAQVFPLFFFLVAALVALTSMTRMVEDDRGEIGTLKALGYTTFQIASRYLAYAGLASLLGCILGTAVLSQLLPSIVMAAYGIMYVVPALPVPLPVDVPLALASGAAGIGITLASTFCAVWAEMRSAPAALMQPKAPRPGKRIWLERIRPVWSHIGFLWKVTFRNLFRYKRRLVMTIVGIAGCTALLVTGLGVRDAISDIITNQFGEIVHYNVDIALASDAGDEERQEVVEHLASGGGSTLLAWGDDRNMMAGSEMSDPLSIRLIVPEDPGAFSQLVAMRERVGHAPVALDDDSVLVSEKLSRELGISVGDTIMVYGQDEIGNAAGEGTPLQVTGIVENYLSYYVYVGRDAIEAAFGEKPSFCHLYAEVPGDAAARRNLRSELHDLSGVDSVVVNDETIATYREMLRTVDQVMLVLVVAAALLAFIVLYNLTNINIAERVREIASLKVLGFTRREVASYVFRETVLLTMLGAAAGLFAGTAMERFVVVTAEVDFVMFGRTIHAASYAAAFVTTLVFTFIVMAALLPKLRRIDMVESLKSVD